MPVSRHYQSQSTCLMSEEIARKLILEHHARATHLEEDLTKAFTAQPVGQNPHVTHLGGKLLLKGHRSWPYSCRNRLCCESYKEIVFLVPRSPDICFLSLIPAAFPGRAIALHSVMPDPNKYMLSESAWITLSIMWLRRTGYAGDLFKAQRGV